MVDVGRQAHPYIYVHKHTWCALVPDLLTVRCFRSGPAYSGGMRPSFAAVTASGVSPCMITIPGHQACAWCRCPPGFRCPHHTSRVGRAQMDEYSIMMGGGGGGGCEGR